VSPQRRRPNPLWLFFWGRKRAGFPGLLVGLLLASLTLGLIFGLPGGASLSRWAILVSAAALVLLIVASVILALWATLFPRRRR